MGTVITELFVRLFHNNRYIIIESNVTVLTWKALDDIHPDVYTKATCRYLCRDNVLYQILEETGASEDILFCRCLLRDRQNYIQMEQFEKLIRPTNN